MREMLGRGRRVMLAAVLLSLLAAPVAAGEDLAPDVTLWFFWGDGCDLCEQAAAWLEELDALYPDLAIHRAEVWFDRQERERYLAMMEERGLKASWVPAFILEDSVWEGFNEYITVEIRWEVGYRFSGGFAGAVRMNPSTAGRLRNGSR